MLTLALGVVVVGGCQTAASGVGNGPNTAAPTVVATPAATRAIAVAAATPTRPVAVAVAAPAATATAVLVGDYASLALPRLEVLQRNVQRLEQQLVVLQNVPLRMGEDDWRNQTLSILDDLFATTADVRSLGTRVGSQADLDAEVLKLADDLDFVADEYRMALDYDPDSSHFIRAGRAEKTTAAELDSVLADVQRSLRRLPPTATPAG